MSGRCNYEDDETGATHEEMLDQMACDIDLLRAQLAALKHTVVVTIGGVDAEGNPTSEINYLQRLRILVAKEESYNQLISAAKSVVCTPWNGDRRVHAAFKKLITVLAHAEAK